MTTDLHRPDRVDYFLSLAKLLQEESNRLIPVERPTRDAWCAVQDLAAAARRVRSAAGWYARDVGAPT